MQLGFLHGRAKRHDDAVRVLREAVNIEPKRPSSSSTSAPRSTAPAVRPLRRRAAGRALAWTTRTATSTSSSGWCARSSSAPTTPSARSAACIAIDPKHAEAYNYIGYMYAERGTNLTEALELVQHALALEPENGYFIDSLGWVYYQQGRYPEALRELQRAADRAKDDPVIFDHLGDAYLKNDKVERGDRGVGEGPPGGQGRPHRPRGEEQDPGRAGEAAPGQGWRRPRPSRSSRLRLAGGLLLAVGLSACATVPPAPAPTPIAEDARAAARRALEQHRRSWSTCASLVDSARAAAGAPSASPASCCSCGSPPRSGSRPSPRSARRSDRGRRPAVRHALGGADNRAYIAPASPDANRRWLGLALGGEDLVALLAGRARPLPDPTRGSWSPPTRSARRSGSPGATSSSASGSTPPADRRSRSSGPARIPRG